MQEEAVDLAMITAYLLLAWIALSMLPLQLSGLALQLSAALQLAGSAVVTGAGGMLVYDAILKLRSGGYTHRDIKAAAAAFFTPVAALRAAVFAVIAAQQEQEQVSSGLQQQAWLQLTRWMLSR
jgi:hypothetical protein